MSGKENISDLMKKVEEIRALPIKRFDRQEEIPCNECSDLSRLCQSPLVSVLMITYNHENFIEEAIQHIVEQKCDFNFELVIGEDHSTDETRKICFEYQKRYPQNIRVLYSDSNVGIRSNFYRCAARLRGKYVAFCEGDDYWSLSNKLQMQTSYLEDHTDCSVVYTNADELVNNTGAMQKAVIEESLVRKNEATKIGFLLEQGFWFRTATMCCRHDLFHQLLDSDLFKLDLSVGDTAIRLFMALRGRVHFINTSAAVYRWHSGGVSANYLSALKNSFHNNLIRMMILQMALASRNGLHLSRRESGVIVENIIFKLATSYWMPSIVSDIRRLLRNNTVDVRVKFKVFFYFCHIPAIRNLAFKFFMRQILQAHLRKTAEK
jgi:glycosyltransferase involved in cell wall biosynthesis